MGKDYFNTLETDKIFNLKKPNPYLALKKYEEYFDQYPKDYSTYWYYIDTLLVVGKINEAERVIKKVKELVANDNNYFQNSERMRLFNRNMHYVVIKLLLLKKEFQEAMDYQIRYKDEIFDIKVNAVDILCQKQIGKLKIEREKGFSYIYKQFIEYSEKDFLEQVKKHFVNTDEKSKVECYFVSDFPLLEVIKEIKKYMPSDKVLYTGFGDSNYYFKYDGCGRYYKKVENYFKVACIYGTNNIITMYPIDYGDDLPYVDLNYMIKNNEKINEPNDDRIAKFYKRLEKSKK